MSLPFSRLIRQPRYEAAMTEAPAAMANPCRERPTAELTGLEVCIPRRRDNRATPLSIFEVRDASEVKVKVNTVSQLRPGGQVSVLHKRPFQIALSHPIKSSLYL